MVDIHLLAKRLVELNFPWRKHGCTELNLRRPGGNCESITVEVIAVGDVEAHLDGVFFELPGRKAEGPLRGQKIFLARSAREAEPRDEEQARRNCPGTKRRTRPMLPVRAAAMPNCIAHLWIRITGHAIPW